MASKKKRERAAELVLAEACRAGAGEASLGALTALSDEGNAGAAAVVAQLAAALGQWEAVVRHGARFLAKPVGRTGNLFTDVTRLVRRAVVDELKEPARLGPIAQSVPEKWHSMRDATLLRDRVGVAPARPEAFAEAIALAPTLPRFKKDAAGLPRHLFALACTYAVDTEIIARWRDDADWAWFDGAMDVARALVRAGQSDRAWRTLERWLPHWRPVDELQVFPVEVLVDASLRTLMNEERGRATLTGSARVAR